MTGPTVNMTSILDDSPVNYSSSKRDVIVEELPAGLLETLSSVSQEAHHSAGHLRCTRYGMHAEHRQQHCCLL